VSPRPGENDFHQSSGKRRGPKKKEKKGWATLKGRKKTGKSSQALAPLTRRKSGASPLGEGEGRKRGGKNHCYFQKQQMLIHPLRSLSPWKGRRRWRLEKKKRKKGKELSTPTTDEGEVGSLGPRPVLFEKSCSPLEERRPTLIILAAGESRGGGRTPSGK